MTELEQLYRAWFSDVYLYLKRLTGDEHLAEDLLVKGTQTASYNLPRDLSLIVAAALLLYAAFLIGRALWEGRQACSKPEI